MQITENQVFEKLKNSRDITSLPQILAEVIRVSRDEESSIKDLADVISRDPVLTSRVLRMVNSPYYGLSRQVGSIKQAVISLGGRPVRALALSTSLYRMFDNGGGVVDGLRFWRHSLETAIACREIASLCGFSPPEEAFAAGLMHDLGILLLESLYPEAIKRIWEQVECCEDLVNLEEMTFGTNHARVGQYLLDLWQLPPLITGAVAAHHADFSPGKAILAEDILARIVCLGNMLSRFRACRLTVVGHAGMQKIRDLCQSLMIPHSQVANLQSEILNKLIQESEFLEIKIGAVTDLLEAANRLLFRQYLLVEEVLQENRQMQEQIAREHAKKAALDTLKTITVTLSHYINNASATILGRAQMIQMAMKNRTLTDNHQLVGPSMEMIIKSVDTISLVLEELKRLSSFDTVQYLNETSILDIEARLKAHIENAAAGHDIRQKRTSP